MKTQIGIYVDVGTADELRSRASASGVSIGDLADLCMRYSLERMPAETIRRWAAGRAHTKGRLAGAHTKDEKSVLGAFEVLPSKPANEGAWRFSLSDIASEAGLRLTDTFWALKSLQKRGTVHGMELEELDRWGRPVKSYWSMISAMPEHAKPKAQGAV